MTEKAPERYLTAIDRLYLQSDQNMPAPDPQDLWDEVAGIMAENEVLTAERDALAAEVERLREALVPFVQHLRERPVSDTNAKFVLAPWHMGDGGWLAAMDFCKARAALEGGKDG